MNQRLAELCNNVRGLVTAQVEMSREMQESIDQSGANMVTLAMALDRIANQQSATNALVVELVELVAGRMDEDGV